MRIYNTGKTPQLQARATLAQANPISGTLYTVLATKSNARIVTFGAAVTWAVQPNPLQIHVSADSQSIIHNQANPVSTTPYYPRPMTYSPEQAYADWYCTSTAQGYTFYGEFRSVGIKAETTGGTVSLLSGYVIYGVY